MQLSARELLKDRVAGLLKIRAKIAVTPTLALIWVGEDPQTATFIRKKQAFAKKLSCQFSLHHFPAAEQQQLEAVLNGLNNRSDIDGIVIQLPLPKNVDDKRLIMKVNPLKDVDNLTGHSRYDSPTPSGIIALLEYHKINLAQSKTVVLGAGKLVGAPLAKKFAVNNWPLTIIAKQARQHAPEIRQHNLLISGTGVSHIVTKEMVNKEMIVIDGSGIDVDITTIEPLVKAITPARGAIGPLTICFLFANLLQAVSLNTLIKK